MTRRDSGERGGLAVRVLHWIFRVFPATDLIFKQPEGRASSEYEEECQIPFHSWFNAGSQLFAGRDVLDLGSGFGGRAVRYREYGARTVIGVEVDFEKAAWSRAFAVERQTTRVRFLAGVGERIPLQSESFDLIVLYDVMEHVVSPAEVLEECRRVLRPGGLLALTFPPYYALMGGSHLHGYATVFPGLNLVFTPRTLRRAAQSWLDRQGVDYRPFFRDAPTDKLFNMNGLTVGHYRRLVRASGFSVDYVHYRGHLEGRLKEERRLPASLRGLLGAGTALAARMPFLGEVWCSRVSALLRK